MGEGRAHVPFRNSKLTHLMEPCLSGQGKTMMIVNVGPEAENGHETLCSLRFASQVSQCTTGGKPKRSAKTLTKAADSAPAAASASSSSSGAQSSRGQPLSARGERTGTAGHKHQSASSSATRKQ